MKVPSVLKYVASLRPSPFRIDAEASTAHMFRRAAALWFEFLKRAAIVGLLQAVSHTSPALAAAYWLSVALISAPIQSWISSHSFTWKGRAPAPSWLTSNVRSWGTVLGNSVLLGGLVVCLNYLITLVVRGLEATTPH